MKIFQCVIACCEQAEKKIGFIDWCNTNNGFLTALLSLLTLAVSVIAVVVSIHTARIPYMKRLILSSDVSILFGMNNYTGQPMSQFSGITINATNIGNRNINLTFLGFALRSSFKLQKIQTMDRELGGKGILEPTAVATIEYTAKELLIFEEMKPRTKVYCCAMDTEGKTYLKYYGRAGKISSNLQKI